MKLSVGIRKCVLLFLGCMFIMGVAAQDQIKSNSSDANKMAQKETQVMKKELSLTSDQTSKIQSINLKYAKSVEGLSNDDIKKLDNAKDAEYKKVLTSEQYNKYQNEKMSFFDKAKKDVGKTYDKAKSGVEKTYDKAKTGTEKTYDKAKSGVEKTYDKAKEAVQ